MALLKFVKKSRPLSLAIASALSLNACSKPTSFSLLSTAQNFQQSQAVVNNKIDILWVVDNSGSMQPLQQELTQNFNDFIARFQNKGFDYQMAVTTTDAYLSERAFRNQPDRAAFQDGIYGMSSGHSGFSLITPFIDSSKIVPSFVTNASQGSGGSGDERAFQSIFDTLNYPLNQGFLRPGAFHAVIILSDEDDFTDAARPEYSWQNGGITDHNYSNPNLPSVANIVKQLDNLTLSSPANRNYSVSAITVLDSQCQTSHMAQSSVTIVGQRYIDLANATNGILGSVCDPSYSTSLNFIQQKLVELLTKFTLNQQPNVSTISVNVDNQKIAQDSVNGWSYDSASNSIYFHGTSVPSASSSIQVNFDPASLR